MEGMLNGVLSEILFGNIGAGIPSYVRNDNADAACQLDSANTVDNEKRINSFVESNRGSRKQQMVDRAVYPGGINTPDGLTKRLYNVNLGNSIT